MARVRVRVKVRVRAKVSVIGIVTLSVSVIVIVIVVVSVGFSILTCSGLMLNMLLGPRHSPWSCGVLVDLDDAGIFVQS